jgi:hypothetical protein
VVGEVVVPEIAEEFARLRFDGGGLGGGGGEGSRRGGCGWCGRAEVCGDVDVEDAVAGGDGLVDVGEDAVGLVGGVCQGEGFGLEKGVRSLTIQALWEDTLLSTGSGAARTSGLMFD